MAEKLNLKHVKVLDPMKERLIKLVTFVPSNHAEDVREAMFKAGAGHIGNYDSCSYNTEGHGTFRGGDDTNPYIGEKGKLHFEPETKVETIVPKPNLPKVVQAMKQAHPYEEVAYDLLPLLNENPTVGFGIIGELEEEMTEMKFLNVLRDNFKAKGIRYSKLLNKPIRKVALCGGSGSFLLKKAIGRKADVFVTGDFKYHQFFDAENKLVIADIGHYESEQYTLEIIYDLLIKKFPKFAVHLTKLNTNPVKLFKIIWLTQKVLWSNLKFLLK
jgi:hypothetical protein